MEDLAVRAKAGDMEAFTDLVRRYQAMAHGYAWATLGDRDLAADAAQQAFITAWRSLPSLTHPERFGGWLRGIVRFECLHLLRQRRRPTLPLDAAAHVASSTPGPATLAEEGEAAGALLAAVAALPEGERIVVTLCSLHDHRQREVAGFLNLPVSTVNNRLRAARRHLRQQGFAPMGTHQPPGLPGNFATRIGEVIHAKGPIVDARFAPDQRPLILNAVAITDSARGRTLTAQVSQYLDDDLVRCFVLDGETPAQPGQVMHDAEAIATLPLDVATLLGIVDRLRGDSRHGTPLETGIKAVDLFCPLGAGSLVGLAGDAHTGKMVLVDELVHRLGTVSPPLAILVFVEAPTEIEALPRLEYRTSAAVEAIYLPVADASPEALGPVLDRLDGVVTLDRQLGEAGLYPAIGPQHTTSNVATDADLADRARALLAGDGGPARADRLRRYLTQPFYVAESYTNRPGVTVPRAEMVADVRAIFDGAADHLDPEALTMTGSLAGSA